MSEMLSLLPLALGIALFGVAIWVLLSKDIGVGTWLLAASLFGHGWVHFMFVMRKQPDTAATANGAAHPFEMARSWLTTGVGIDPGVIRAVAVALIAAVLLGYGLASLATVGLFVPTAWWPGLVVAGTVASVIMLVVFFTPTFFIGFAIDAVLLWVVLASIWAPRVSAAVGVASG